MPTSLDSGIDPDLSKCPSELSPKCQKKKDLAEGKKKKKKSRKRSGAKRPEYGLIKKLLLLTNINRQVMFF